MEPSERKIRILYIQYAAERGGLEISLLNALRFIDKDKFCPTVVFLTQGPFIDEIQAIGVETFYIGTTRVRRLLKTWSSIRQLAKLIKKENIDIVHSNGGKAHLYGGYAAKKAGCPAIYWNHGIGENTSSIFTPGGFIDFLSRKSPATRILGDSYYTKQVLEKHYKNREIGMLYEIPDIDYMTSQVEAHDIRTKYNIHPDSPLVMIAGRLQPWKGQDIFIKASSIVANSFPDARFLVVGGALFGIDIDFPGYLENLAMELGVKNKVMFTGHIHNVRDYMQTSDAIVHASVVPEPFGLVIVEAMMCAKPVIATNIGGPREIVADGECGYLVPPSDPESMAEAIGKLLSSTEIRERMGQAGKARVEEYFNPHKTVRKLEDIYTSVLELS